MNDSDRYASLLKRFLRGNDQPQTQIEEDVPETQDDDDDVNDITTVQYEALLGLTRSPGLVHTTPNYARIIPKVAPAKPTMDSSELTFSVEIDDTIKGLGHATFDPELKRVTCFVPPHINVENVNMDLVVAYYDQNKKTVYSELSYPPGVFEISEDESIKPCCIFYSPSKDEVALGAAQVKDYPFSKPRKVSSCSNPEVTGAKHVYVPCHAQHNNSSCNFATLSDWEPVALGYDNQDVLKVSLERKLYAHGIPSFRVRQSDGIVSLDPTTNFAEARTGFENVIENNGYQVIRPEEAKKSYFKAVLVATN